MYVINVKSCGVSDVATISDGFPFDVKDIHSSGLYPVVKISNIEQGSVVTGDAYVDTLPSKNKSILVGREILVGMSGSTGKNGFNHCLTNAVVNQRIAIIRANTDKTSSGYLKHLLVNQEFEQYCFFKGTGPQHNIGKNIIGEHIVSVPPIEIQNKIVSVLDKFSALVEETTGLLPKEIELAQKRYEYFRDKLLSFK